MRRVPKRRYVVFVVLSMVGCAADLVSKEWVFAWQDLQWGEVYWLWDGHAGIQKSLNEGALFGMGQGMVWLFAAMSIIAAVAIPVWLFWFRAARDAWLTVALGCVMAGVLGNLYDRLGFAGLTWPGPGDRVGKTVYAVRDWILLQWNDNWTWPNFNIADSLLVAGAFLLLTLTFAQQSCENRACATKSPSDRANCTL